MTSRRRNRYGKILGALGGAAVLLTLTSPPRLAVPGASARTALAADAGPAAGGVSPVTRVSRCPGRNAEVETATGAPHYVYDLWIGCGGIGFARSSDGGLHFGRSMTAPGSAGSSWDPAITVSSAGVVYISFMHQAHHQMYPVVDASFDHGVSFPQVSSLRPPGPGNWGDRDFIAVSGQGVVYVTWDYGPSARLVELLCSRGGSCAYKAGDLNAVIQRSAVGGGGEELLPGVEPVGRGLADVVAPVQELDAATGPGEHRRAVPAVAGEVRADRGDRPPGRAAVGGPLDHRVQVARLVRAAAAPAAQQLDQSR